MKLIRAQQPFDVIRLGLVIAGLAAWLVGTNLPETHVMGINVGENLSHLGFLVAVLAFVHWIYEYRLIGQLKSEIVMSVLGATKVAESGISDYVRDSKEIDYKDDISKSNKLAVCVHYSPRFLDDNFDALKKRKRKRQVLTIVALREGRSLDYLLETRHGHDHIRPNMKKVRTNVDLLREEGVNVIMVAHDSILRYSFVLSDHNLWIKFYKNALGKAQVPAINIRRGSALFSFFEADIKCWRRRLIVSKTVEDYIGLFGPERVLNKLSELTLSDEPNALTIVCNAGVHRLPNDILIGEVYYASEGNIDFASSESVLAEYDRILLNIATTLKSSRWDRIYVIPHGPTTLAMQIKLLCYRVLGFETVDWFYASHLGYFKLDIRLRDVSLGAHSVGD